MKLVFLHVINILKIRLLLKQINLHNDYYQLKTVLENIKVPQEGIKSASRLSLDSRLQQFFPALLDLWPALKILDTSTPTFA